MSFLGKILSIFGIHKVKIRDSNYNANLVKELKEEHKELFSLYKEILKYAKKRKYKKVLDDLNSFSLEYQTHIQMEEQYFYPYVFKKYENNPNLYSMLKKKQEEMQGITKVLINFLNKYSTVDKIEKKYYDFMKELEKIGEVLTERVHFEEHDMYRLYVR